MEAICYLSTTFTNFLPVFEEIRQCIACTCYALFSSSVSSTCEGTSLPRFPTQKVGKIRPRAQAAPPPLYMEEGARPNPPPRAAAAAKSARGKSKSILPPSPHTLTPHSYPLFPPPPRPWHSLPKWAASSVVEGGRGKGIGGPARGRRGDGKTARRSTVLVEGRRKRGMRISPSVRPFVTVLVPPAQPSQVIPPPLPPSNKCRSFSPSLQSASNLFGRNQPWLSPTLQDTFIYTFPRRRKGARGGALPFACLLQPPAALSPSPLSQPGGIGGVGALLPHSGGGCKKELARTAGRPTDRSGRAGA